MFIRTKYLNQLINNMNQPTVKILVGVRRCGKTTILDQFRASLRRQEVTPSQIQIINFEYLQDNELSNPEYLLQFIVDRLCKHQMNYLFLDEIEIVPEFARVINALNSLANTDIYITSSNKTILNESNLQQMAPTVVIPVFPCSYREYLKRNQQDADSQTLYQYLNTGGFPYTHEIHGPTNLINYINGIINTIIITDFTQQATLCNPGLTKQLARHLAHHAGTTQNISQIVDGLKRHHIPTSNKTVDFYLQFLQTAFIFYPCKEYDFSRHYVKSTNIRYYPVDPSIRQALTFKKNVLSQRILESIIFIDLLSRGYQAYSGRIKDKEITFVAVKNEIFTCIQVAYSLADDAAYHRAICGLSHLPAKYNKVLVTVKPALNYAHLNPNIKIIDLYSWLTE
ncbi:ATP-binding protein [Limosilactobacillus sp. STM2_1]|uniref:ATP-binding protein n=1 Tax=Limosilactobacillus rudii TaxID=2759755 RepID=A0A7W3UL49_9LACO|nr:ATP-binding protein [Limosilactobacillus rudii]MBB1079551.1 ATP-binding protein [Limosilactobacillus rudii]MBB1097597.1 ATP-binding protein [Limosilactobacillus rudii]MCD7134706.1 ATP-binding protein [Limosilactobacillus rudii]